MWGTGQPSPPAACATSTARPGAVGLTGCRGARRPRPVTPRPGVVAPTTTSGSGPGTGRATGAPGTPSTSSPDPATRPESGADGRRDRPMASRSGQDDPANLAEPRVGIERVGQSLDEASCGQRFE